MVLDMHHDIIVGLKWFEYHGVDIRPRGRKLLFPEDWGRGPPTNDIPMDHDGHQARDPHWDRDVRRRDKAMDHEDKRRRDGCKSTRPVALPKAVTGNPREVASENPRLEKEPPSKTTPDPELEKRLARVSWDHLPVEATSVPLTLGYLEKDKLDTNRRSTDPKYLPKAILRAPRTTTSAHRECDAGLKSMEKQLDDDDRNLSSLQPPKEATTEQKGVDRPEILYACGRPYVLRKGSPGFYKQFIDVAVVGAVAFSQVAHENPNIDTTTLHEIDKIILDKVDERRQDQLPYDEEELRRKAFEQVPEEYHHELNQFSKHDSDILAPHRYIDHKIKLNEGVVPEDSLGYSALYKMSLEELEAARKYITENLKKGFIESSNAPWAAPVLMARKGDGGLRFCVDYRKLNAISKRDQYPLPLIDETLAQVSKAKIFTKIDIRQAFHRIRFASPEDEELTTFRCRYGSFKYKVLPFGLTNGPSTFQRFINDTLREHLDEFCHAYIDDILIYSNSLQEHREHVKWVLQQLRKAGLQADLKKCEFHVTKTKYLGFIVGTDGVSVDPAKVEAIEGWEAPSNVKEVQAFLGFANFYRRFVKDYSRLAKPLTDLTRKDEPWQWNNPRQKAFDAIRHSLMTAPLLKHFDHALETKVETDASGGVIAGVLSQKQPDDGDWHPVAFFSKTMHGAELNYAIHDKELMAIVRSLETWRVELEGLQRKEPFSIITDHRALEFFMTKRLLNSRQANWADILSRYHFVITYRPGADNTIADSLTRKAQELRTLKARQEDERTMAIFKAAPTEVATVFHFATDPTVAHIDAILSDIHVLSSDRDPPPLSGVLLADALLQANREDNALEVYRKRAHDQVPHWTMLGKYVLYRGRLVVSADNHLRTRVIEELHARITSAHPGKTKTRRMVSAKYWWPGVHADCDIYVDNCPCRSSKHPRDKTPGYLHPIPIPLRPWLHVVVDFNEMPKTKKGNDNTMNIIDKFSKETWSAACSKTVTAKDVAWMYYHGPLRCHGLPLTVGSDRGPQFIADFTQEMARILGIKWKLSSSGHSQSAGQIENYHEWMNQRLRMFANHYQDNWDDALPAMDIAQASTPHDALGGLSPFEVTHGYPMPLGFDWEQRTMDLKQLSPRERLNREEAQEMASAYEQYVDTARKALQHSQDRMVQQTNKHRREPDFGPGDKVFIIKKIWSTDRPSEKLNFPLTQQAYRIKEMSGYSYRLEVPQTWRGSDVYHADRLRRCADNPLPGQDFERPDAEIIDREEEFEVEQVLSSRIHRNKLQYQVQWRGWDPDPLYYDADNFKNSPAALAAFHDANPDCEGPPMRLRAWEQAWKDEVEDRPHADDNKPAEGKKGLVKARRSARLKTK